MTTANLPRALVFGTGSIAELIISTITREYQVTAFIDNNETKWGTTYFGLPVHSPQHILETSYDAIIIATLLGWTPITKQLTELGVENSKICDKYLQAIINSRIIFLEKLGEIFNETKIPGCTAEGGVYHGDFSREINRVFPDRKLYLFDTFSGFNAEDVSNEADNSFSTYGEGFLSNPHEEIVLKKLPHPEMCIIKKGHFPGTTQDIDETFCFVNLDFDLYQPILAGLEYFYPRMAPGGVILIHDYFCSAFKGVKAAVDKFEAKTGKLRRIPIGDGLSIAILC